MGAEVFRQRFARTLTVLFCAKRSFGEFEFEAEDSDLDFTKVGTGVGFGISDEADGCLRAAVLATS